MVCCSYPKQTSKRDIVSLMKVPFYLAKKIQRNNENILSTAAKTTTEICESGTPVFICFAVREYVAAMLYYCE